MFIAYGLFRGNSLRDTWEEVVGLFTGGIDG
jgi:hypothetical protein